MRRLFCYLVFLLSMSAMAEEPTAYQVYYTHFPPISYHSKHHGPSGISFDVFNEIIRRTGGNYKISYYPLKRLYKALQLGRVDITLTIHNKAFEKHYWYSKNSVFSLDLNAWWLKNRFSSGALEQFKAKRLAKPLGYKFLSGFEKKLHGSHFKSLHDVPSTGAGIKMLTSNRIDYLLEYETVFSIAQKKAKSVQFGHQALTSIELFYVVNRRFKNARAMVEQFDEALKELKKENFIESNLIKYF